MLAKADPASDKTPAASAAAAIILAVGMDTPVGMTIRIEPGVIPA